MELTMVAHAIGNSPQGRPVQAALHLSHYPHSFT